METGRFTGNPIWYCCFLMIFVFAQFAQNPSFCELGNPPKERVILQLRWDHQFQFAGYYAAKWLGYYDEAGLDVEIRKGVTDSGIISATDEVANGEADFGIGSSDILVAQSRNPEFIIVSSIFQKSPVEYSYISKKNIKNIYELSKMNIARRYGDLLDIELQAMLRNEGIDYKIKNYSQINRDFEVDDLISGTYDVVPNYLGKLEYSAKKRGIKVKSIQATDYGIDFYGDTLFTSKNIVTSKPEVVEAFRKATVRGWEYALENPKKIASMMAKKFKGDLSVKEKKSYIDYNLHQARIIKKVTHYPIVNVGNVNANRWQKMSETLKMLNIIPEVIKVDGMIFNYEQIKYDKLNNMFKIVDVILIIGIIVSVIVFMTHLRGKNKTLFLSNSRYETIFNSSVIGIAISDDAGNIIHNNAGWIAMTGLEDDSESLGKNIREFICKDSLGSDDELLDRLMRGEISNYVIEKRYKKKTKDPKENDFFYGKLFMTRIYDMNSKKEVSMAMTVDITGEVIERIENAKKEAVIIYQSRMAAMGEMIGNIAHQWRQPLNALSLIIANTKDAAISKDHDTDYLTNAYEKAEMLIQKMSMTIDDFRNFSNPQSKPKQFSVEICIQKTLDLFEEQLHKAEIQVISENTTRLEIFGHENQFSQAFFNLISNSIESLKLKDTGRTIRIIIDEALNENIDDENGLMVAVYICDNGAGVDPSIKSKIFNMYYTTRDKFGGTGLGLYMTKTIIENNFNGSIVLVEDGVCEGACFEIKVPACEIGDDRR